MATLWVINRTKSTRPVYCYLQYLLCLQFHKILENIT